MRWLESERWPARILLFCASLALSSVVLEEISVHLGSIWIWFLVFICWKLSGRWSRKAFPLREELATESPVIDVRPRRETGFRVMEQLLTATIFLLAAYHMLFYFFEYKGLWMIKNMNLNGDWPFHLHQIRYLVRLNEFWPENPIFVGDHLRYAFGVNWLTALFVRGGLPLGLVIAVSAVILLLVFVNQLYQWYGLPAVLIFFLSGGGWDLSPGALGQAWGPGSQLAWKNLFLAIFVPQRGMWIALPIGVFLLRLFFRHLDQPGGLSKQQKKVWAFLWAMLPFFHLHTFALITLIVLIMAVLTPMPPLLFYLFPRAFIPAFFLFKSVGKENVNRSLQVVTNWMSETEPALQSWINNFGPWLAIPFLLLIVPRVFRSAPLQRKLFYVILGMFVLFSHVLLAAWRWDQSRIILWLFLILTGIFVLRAQAWMETHLPRQVPVRPLIWFFIFCISLPGFWQFFGGRPAALPSYALWKSEDVATVQALLESLAPGERVIIAPDPHHPIFATGQPVIAGYEGHLWSHGIDIAGLQESLKKTVLGQSIEEPRWQRLRASYLLWGPEEKLWLNVEEPPAEAAWIKINSLGNRTLYFRNPQ